MPEEFRLDEGRLRLYADASL